MTDKHYELRETIAHMQWAFDEMVGDGDITPLYLHEVAWRLVNLTRADALITETRTNIEEEFQ